MLAAVVDVAHAALHWKHRAVLAAAFHFAEGAAVFCWTVFDAVRDVTIVSFAAELGHERIDATAGYFLQPVSENRDRRGVYGLDYAVLIDGYDAIGRPVEHRFEPRLALCKRHRGSLTFRILKCCIESLLVHTVQDLGHENDDRGHGKKRNRRGPI